MADGKEPHTVEEVLEDIEEIAEEQDEVCLGDALDKFGHASFAPLLILLPLVGVSPIGGVPGIPSTIAAIIILVALQMLLGKDHIWIPDFIENRTVDGDKLASTAHRLDTIANKLDQLLGQRLDFLTRGKWVRIAAFFILVLCTTIPPLEFVPFAAILPLLAIAIFGLALLVRDGLLALVAYGLTGTAAYLLISQVFSSSS